MTHNSFEPASITRPPCEQQQYLPPNNWANKMIGNKSPWSFTVDDLEFLYHAGLIDGNITDPPDYQVLIRTSSMESFIELLGRISPKDTSLSSERTFINPMRLDSKLQGIPWDVDHLRYFEGLSLIDFRNGQVCAESLSNMIELFTAQSVEKDRFQLKLIKSMQMRSLDRKCNLHETY